MRHPKVNRKSPASPAMESSWGFFFTDGALDNDVAYSHQNAGRTRQVGAFRRTSYDTAQGRHDDAAERHVVEAVMGARRTACDIDIVVEAMQQAILAEIK